MVGIFTLLPSEDALDILLATMNENAVFYAILSERHNQSKVQGKVLCEV